MNARCSSRNVPARALLALGLGLTMALAGCEASPQDAKQAEPPAEQVSADTADGAAENAPVEEPEPEPAAPAVSYKDNMDLTFEDIPTERVVDVDELKAMVDGEEKLRLIDIRSWADYDSEHVVNAISIPAGQQVILRIDEISKKITLVLIAQENERLAEVRQTLIDLGIPEENILVLDGGLDAWKDAGYPVKSALEGEVYRC